jgi:rhodanese-related sulfurtransferase
VRSLHSALAVVAGLLSLAAAAWDWRGPAAAAQVPIDYIAAPDLAERILRGDPALRVWDLRSSEEFEQMHVPTALPMTLAALADEPLPASVTVVLYANDDRRAFEAWALVRRRGHRDVLLLRQGLYEWIGRVLEPRLAADATAEERTQFERAASQSRFFGGVPRANVERREVPVGYWNGEGAQAGLAEATRNAVAGVRRRGC